MIYQHYKKQIYIIYIIILKKTTAFNWHTFSETSGSRLSRVWAWRDMYYHPLQRSRYLKVVIFVCACISRALSITVPPVILLNQFTNRQYYYYISTSSQTLRVRWVVRRIFKPAKIRRKLIRETSCSNYSTLVKRVVVSIVRSWKE